MIITSIILTNKITIYFKFQLFVHFSTLYLN